MADWIARDRMELERLSSKGPRNKVRDDTAVRRGGDPLARFNSADVATEIVLQLTNAS